MKNLQARGLWQAQPCPTHLSLQSLPVAQRSHRTSSRQGAGQQARQQPACSRCSARAQQPRGQITVHAASVETQAPSTSQAEQQEPAAQREPEYYEMTLAKPLGIQLARGLDSAAYVIKSDSDIGNTDQRIQLGDKVVNVSASFGTDIWDAKNFGQVLYAIKTRNGEVFLRFQKMYGDMSALQPDDTPEELKRMKAERNKGNYGANTQVIQQQNYTKRKQDEKDREDMFNGALGKFRAGDVEGALVDFENVISLEPPGYRKDLSKYSPVYRVAQYNVACCYSSTGALEPGLEALRKALDAGFEGFSKIREDPNLAKLRQSPGFQPLLDQYDEPVFSSGALDAIKGFFSFGRK